MGKRKWQLALVYVGEGSSHGRQRVEAQDEEVHISQEARPIASDNDEIQALAENAPKSRGPTRLADIWALDGSWKIPFLLNDEGQPIGPNDKTFGPCLCSANSTFAFQKRYLIDLEIVTPFDQMEWAMHQLEVLRRNRRTNLKKDHYKCDMTKEQVLAKVPPKVDLVQWAKIVNY
nr:hypothetical protein CFP56_55587 [Quercus suber]